MRTYVARALAGKTFIDTESQRLYEILQLNVSPDPKNHICLDINYLDNSEGGGIVLSEHLDDLEAFVGQFEALFKKR